MPISKWVGQKVTAHHPRGGTITGVVLKVEREPGRGMIATLSTGNSIGLGDIISADPLPAVYCSTYCNFGHSMTTGKPLKHECRHIPPAALRLEREGFFAEAIELLQGKQS